MTDNDLPAADFTLSQKQPAYLEVTIDPAAHGPAGLGPIERGAILVTKSGVKLQFSLTAVVVP